MHRHPHAKPFYIQAMHACVCVSVCVLQSVARDQGAEPPGEEDHSDVKAVRADTHTTNHTQSNASGKRENKSDTALLRRDTQAVKNGNTKAVQGVKMRRGPLSSFLLSYHPGSEPARRAAEALLRARPVRAVAGFGDGGPPVTPANSLRAVRSITGHQSGVVVTNNAGLTNSVTTGGLASDTKVREALQELALVS